jgi:cell division protein FtsB
MIEEILMQLNQLVSKLAKENDKLRAEIEQLKALVISLSPNANLIYTKANKND